MKPLDNELQQFIDTAVTKIGDFIVDFLRKFEAIFKKALTSVSGA
jgi:hypothetical protein